MNIVITILKSMHKDILTNMKKGILLASLLCGVSCLSSCSEEPLSSVNQDYPIVISFYRYYEWGEDVLSDEFLANNEVFLTKGYEEEFVIDYDWIEETQRECNEKLREFYQLDYFISEYKFVCWNPSVGTKHCTSVLGFNVTEDTYVFFEFATPEYV